MLAAVSDDPLQDVITRNVRVLMAVRGINTQQQLSDKVGIAKAELSKRFSGRQRWQVRDLPALASALGVEPPDLLRDIAQAIGLPAAAAATGTEGNITGKIR